jgi:uracil-DNA glycosylase family 4
MRVAKADSLRILENDIVSCEQCPRLREWCRRVAAVKRRAYRDEEYWGRPVPGFGDPNARLLILGLAPGAHGANRTGRVFTGDASGDFLFRALHEAGFASQPSSRHRGDGLKLRDAWVTASVRCAPPDNKPAPEEVRSCRAYIERELALLKRVQVAVALGRLAFDTMLVLCGARKSRHAFAHNRLHDLGPGQPALLSSYHPSQQNTQTGRLTPPMFLAVFQQARALLQRSA